MNKILIAMFCAGVTVAASAADPVISNVSISGEYNRTYVVSFKLTGAPAIVSLGAETNVSGDVWLPLKRDAFVGAYGDVNKVLEPSDAVRHIYWPVSSVAHVIAADKVRAVVKAWKKDAPPDWMLLSLKKDELDLPNFTRLSFYESEREIPNGWTSRCSKVEQIVFRKVPAKNVTWRMGTSDNHVTVGSGAIEKYHTVTFTNDYYVSIFKVTQGQWSNVCVCAGGPNKLLGGYRLVDTSFSPNAGENTETGDWPVLPCRASLPYVRGDGATGFNWPETGHSVLQNRFLSALRLILGNQLSFDLPTEAQWEYFCRAGTATKYYDGSSNGSGINWTKDNANGAFQEVGKLKSNNWGLFDFGGNGHEKCLDVYDKLAEDSATWSDGTVDPQGKKADISLDPTTGRDNVKRATRGCSVVWPRAYEFDKSAGRYNEATSYAACIRLVVPAELP